MEGEPGASEGERARRTPAPFARDELDLEATVAALPASRPASPGDPASSTERVREASRASEARRAHVDPPHADIALDATMKPTSSARHVFEPAKSAARLGRTQLCPTCGLRFAETAHYCPFDGAELRHDGEREATSTAKTSERHDEWIGQVLSGRYRVDRYLGEGRLGEVYQVTHGTLGRVFAVKILKDAHATKPGLGGRFLREARAAGRVEHPNVVRVTDYGTHAGRPFLVMEMTPGISLRKLLEQGPLDPKRAAGVVRQVAEALCAAHGAGVVHRDLRPESILVDANDGDRVRVLDFGLARILGEGTLTEPGEFVGSPEYMSPEQAAGGTVDPRSDQYALGVLFYELLTGRPPFRGSSMVEVLSKHMYQKPVPPSERVRGVDVSAFEGIVLRALEKRPLARFESIETFLAHLDRAIGRRSRRKSRRGRVDSVPGIRRSAAERWVARAADWLSDAWRRPKKDQG